MANWTPARSVLLSQLLDDVVGTKEMVQIRQDYCRLYDCMISTYYGINLYYTGSRAEGLDLPGSDDDFMLNINYIFDILVIQNINDLPTSEWRNVFLMSTENVSPCFSMLKSVNQIQINILLNACQISDGFVYLSSYLFIEDYIDDFRQAGTDITASRQGPSMEQWDPFMDTSQSEQDFVPSIHCPFWPDAALEWRSRRRRFGWPCPSDIMSIIDFGFHLVPVGHPNSDTNMMEWRLSFSIAERKLVWSFSHIQLQCYAVMKIILKEFIHPHCNPDNRILCSYFIKTFLFWKYENTNPSFWCQENFRNCIMFLLSGFRECVSCGILKHYFVKRFNLLSVKLTETARTELLQAFDIILQSDIRILKECDTLKTVWAQIVSHNDDVISCFDNKDDRIG